MDAERIERFDKLAGAEHPWPAVFSPAEVLHAASLTRPAEGFCASFCCKEAMVKALEKSFPYPQCELLFDPRVERQELRISPDLALQGGVARCEARVFSPRDGELAAVVYLFGA